MKTIKLFLVAILAAGICYFYFDKELFYYGRSHFDFYNLLPMSIKPEFTNDFEKGFVLMDEYGFFIVSENNSKYTYRSSPDKNIDISKVIKYGFNNERLVALIKDINGDKYYINSIKDVDYETNGKSFLNVINENDFINNSRCEWVLLENNEDFIGERELLRNRLEMIIVVLVFIIIYLCLKMSKPSKKA
jgi:hypothetical protein